MDTRFALNIRALGLLLLSACVSPSFSANYRGSQFIGFANFQGFSVETNASELVLTSPELKPDIKWNELVPSWNYAGDPTNKITVETQIVYPDHQTKWYSFGNWSLRGERSSVKNQRDADADIATDTLEVRRPGGAARVRIRLTGTEGVGTLKFLGCSFCDSARREEPLPPGNSAWGRVLSVPEKSQADYPEGIKEWCSPTAVSMILSFWARQLSRPDLEHAVPEVARGVNDPAWPGTGNWAFNMAFAGAHNGLRAYTTRFSSITEIESWIDAGIPVAVSVRYGLLKGESKPGNGHLVVCVGFNEDGDVIMNDPGRGQVRQTYRRANLERAWKQSENTVYLIYPAGHAVPADRFGHWFSE